MRCKFPDNRKLAHRPLSRMICSEGHNDSRRWRTMGKLCVGCQTPNIVSLNFRLQTCACAWPHSTEQWVALNLAPPSSIDRWSLIVTFSQLVVTAQTNICTTHNVQLMFCFVTRLFAHFFVIAWLGRPEWPLTRKCECVKKRPSVSGYQ